MEKLFEAIDSRYKCSCCNGKINKVEKYFRDAKQEWQSSHTVNICCGCIVRLFLSLNFDEEEVNKIRKEMIVEKLWKEVKENDEEKI